MGYVKQAAELQRDLLAALFALSDATREAVKGARSLDWYDTQSQAYAAEDLMRIAKAFDKVVPAMLKAAGAPSDLSYDLAEEAVGPACDAMQIAARRECEMLTDRL